ncbi:MAG: hypothetical protein HQK49_08355 [Oligoflexia bacterium]|nr:hypothetical protein [Oligoflexia bacterium]
MKNLLRHPSLFLSLLFLLFLSLSTPLWAISFDFKPCQQKKMFDNMPIPPEQPVAMVAGHSFRKKDVCLPIEVVVTWKNKFNSFDHNFYNLNYSHVFPGELWLKNDTKEFVLTASALTYSGIDRINSMSANGEYCANDDGNNRCRKWHTFKNGSAIVDKFPIPGRTSGPANGGSILYTYPKIQTEDGETIEENLDIMSTGFTFKNSPNEYWVQEPITINNLKLNPFKYSEIVEAVNKRNLYKKTINFKDNNNIEDMPTHHQGEVTIEINFGCPKSLKIISPQKNAKFLFSIDNPSKVEIEAEVALENYPEHYLDNVEWIAPAPKERSQLFMAPIIQKGKKMKYIYLGLPTRNSDLGNTILKAKLDLGPNCGVYEDSVNVQLFFPRDQKNNPGIHEPNWYYYWQQTKAGHGTVEFQDVRYQGTSEMCGTEPTFRGYYPLTSGSLQRGSTFVYICDFSKPDVNFQALSVFGGTEAYDGIDAFGLVLLHELTHRKHWLDWWNPRGGWSDTGSYGSEVVDSDKDYIPDALEAAQGFQSNKKYTYFEQMNESLEMYDEHYLTYKHAETNWIMGSADKEDWSFPGNQWRD